MGGANGPVINPFKGQKILLPLFDCYYEKGSVYVPPVGKKTPTPTPKTSCLSGCPNTHACNDAFRIQDFACIEIVDWSKKDPKKAIEAKIKCDCAISCSKPAGTPAPGDTDPLVPVLIN
jgi:hypothetical protein